MIGFVDLPPDLREDPDAAFGAAPHWSIDQGRRAWRIAEDTAPAFAGTKDGRVVAAAGSFLLQLHPTRHWAFVEVVESERREGIGSTMLRELRRRLPDTATLRCKAQVDSPGYRFAQRSGLEVLMATRTIRVERQSGLEPPDAVIVASASSVSDGAVDAWRRYYAEGHSWDPVGDLPLSYWRETLGTDTTVLLWPATGSVRGIALVGPDGDWTGGAIERADPDGERIASALLAAAFLHHEVLDIEYDDWMVEVGAALATLRHEETDHSVILADPPGAHAC